MAIFKHFNRDVLLLGINESPNLVTLDAVQLQVAEGLILILRTGRAEMPVMRTVEGIDLPSTRQLTTRMRSSVLSRFIPAIMLKFGIDCISKFTRTVNS